MNPQSQPLPAKSESWRAGSKNRGLSLPGDTWTAMDGPAFSFRGNRSWLVSYAFYLHNQIRNPFGARVRWHPRPLNPLQCQPTQVATTYILKACSLQGIKFVLSCFSLFFFLILSSSCKAKLYFSKVSPTKKKFTEKFLSSPNENKQTYGLQ